MWIEEQRVGSPGERLASPAHVIIGGNLWKYTTILVLNVLYVCSVFSFSIVNPCHANSN